LPTAAVAGTFNAHQREGVALKVVQLGDVRDMLAKLDQVRAVVQRGQVKGFSLTILEKDDSQHVFMGGELRHNSELNLKVAMRNSWEQTKHKDFCRSS
jgi:hypothetical protein